MLEAVGEYGTYRTHTNTLSITNKQTNKQTQNYYKPQRKTIRNIREARVGEYWMEEQRKL